MVQKNNTDDQRQDRIVRLVGSSNCELDTTNFVATLARFAVSGETTVEIEVPRSQAIRLARGLNDLLNECSIFTEVFFE